MQSNRLENKLNNIEESITQIWRVLVDQVHIMQKHHDLLLELVQDKRYAADNKPDRS
jgi:hypothetical protein